MSVTNTEKRVKLKGLLPQTASSAEIKDDGSLVVELYDFSDQAHTWLGNDVAFLLKVAPDDKRRLLSLLMAQPDRMPDVIDPDECLLRLIQDQFADYYALKEWFERHDIPYQKEFDSWA
jgi:hypothetical protein